MECDDLFTSMNRFRICELGVILAVTNNSVDRALTVLQFVARARRPVKFTELATATSIPKATLHAQLGSLEQASFLIRTSSGYVVGIAAFEVGTAMPVASSLRLAVASILDRLASTTGEACHFGVLVGTEVVYLDRRDTGEGLRFASRIGQRLPAHATGLGKAMLSRLSDDELRARYPETLPKVTSNTLTTRAHLLEVVSQVRNVGYALESEESTPGVCCIGMAVSTSDGPLGLSITVPLQRASIDDLPRFQPDLAEAITRIGEAAESRRWFGLGREPGPEEVLTS
jgi:DNA-binding IclR family transcriptional regulator